MANLYKIGLDIGTSSCKSIIINEKGEKSTASVESYPVFHPRNNWSEQNPENWWEKSIKSIKKVLNKVKINPKDIVSIGLTSGVSSF
ncbi:MAG: FGGY family carbohydrate kinase [Halanaerobiales bacterium]